MTDERTTLASRRHFVTTALVAAPAVLLAQQKPGGAPHGAGATGEKQGDEQEDVTPPEDLMREHGVLNRVLLIYDESLARLARTPGDADPDVLKGAADVIRRFIEDYHEKQEEDFLFPRFEKAHTLVDLVSVLRAQHQAGRQVTAVIQRLATAAALKSSADRDRLSAALRSFVRMYRPHEAREDTVLFPALRKIVSPHEFDALGEQFEKREHELFGDQGFERFVDRVGELEKRLGIYELSQFTPHT